MAKRGILICLLLLLLMPVFSEPPSEDDVAVTLTVMLDCLNSSLCAEYSPVDLELPCSTVSVDPATGLPQRIAYFLADPSDYDNVFAKALAGGSGNFWSSLFSVVSKGVSDPFLARVSYTLSSRGYKVSDYLLSGAVTFSYPDGTTLEQIKKVWLERGKAENCMNITMNLSLYGLKMAQPMTIAGDFTLSVNDEGLAIVRSVGQININGYNLASGEFSF